MDRSDDMARRDAGLLRVLKGDFARARRLAGERLACRPGCADCCRGPFPITRLDRWRLRDGVRRLGAEDPARLARIRRRARAAVARLRPGFPGDAASGRPVADATVLDAFFAGHAGLACPALEPETGHCEVYPWRPVACRTYGPPLGFGGERAPACPLCFRGAGREEVDRCRIEPDSGGLEERLLRELGAAGSDDWDTLVAFVLAGPQAGDDTDG